MWLVWERRQTHTRFWYGNFIIRDLVRPRHRWVDNIKMEHKGIEWERGLNWFSTGYGHVVECCENGNEPLVFIRCGDILTSWECISSSKKGCIPWSKLLHWVYVQWKLTHSAKCWTIYVGVSKSFQTISHRPPTDGTTWTCALWLRTGNVAT